MKPLTQELINKINNYLNDLTGDYEEEDINTARESLSENDVGDYFSELDNTFITRIINDEKLLNEIEEATKKDDDRNIFD